MNQSVLFENKWCSVIERELYNGIKWVYGHHGWCNGEGVAVLPYRKVMTNPAWNYSELRYLAHMEICPAHRVNEHGVYAVAGGRDHADEAPVATAVRELLEETGYVAREKDMHFLGTCRPSKGTDTLMYLYAVDVTDMELVEPTGDGTRTEELAYTQWFNASELAWNGEPILATMLSRLNSHHLSGGSQ